MVLRLFKGYQAFLLILIPIVGVLLWFNGFFQTEIEIEGQYVFMPLSNLMFNILGYNTVLSKLFAYTLVCFNGLLLVRINILFNFLRARTYLPSVIYILLLSFVPDILRLTPALMASFFIILAINRLLSTFKKDKLAIQVMDASLMVSIASLFYFPALFLISLLWVGLILLRSFNWREWVFTLFGVATPYILLAGIMYITGIDMEIPLQKLINIPFIVNWSILNDNLSIIFFSYLLLLILLASFQLLKLFSTKKVHSRRFFIFFLWQFIITFVLYLFLPSSAVEMLYITAIPLSFLLSHYLIHINRQVIGEVLFIIMIVLVVLSKFLF